MHTAAERGRAAEAASFDGTSRQDGDRAIVGAKRGRKSSGRDDLFTERDSRRIRPRTGGMNDENYTHDGFYARWRLGGATLRAGRRAAGGAGLRCRGGGFQSKKLARLSKVRVQVARRYRATLLAV